MTYKNLVVHVDDSKGCAGRVEAAIRLASAHGAHLTGLYLMDIAPRMPTGDRSARDNADAAAARFQSAVDAAGISGEVRVESGFDTEFPNILSVHGRYADLVMLGQADPDDHAEGAQELPELVVMGSGRPVLIVPYIGAPAGLGERVTIAWDASREAARAVADAMPILEQAKAVTVVSVNPRRQQFGHGEEPGADIGLHLARHDIKVEVQRLESRDVDVANTLLSHIADQSSDLLVMGGYGHSRLRELVLGGVTRTILESMTIPALMSH